MNRDPHNASRRAADEALSASVPEPLAPARNEAGPDHHLRTDHLLANLKGRTVSSGFITVASQGVQFALTMGSTMILARLLTPRDFGVVAMAWTVLSFLRIFREFGLSTATVQREGITHAQVSNLFWINLAVSAFITLLVMSVAPLVAWFYREPRVVGITLFLSVTFLLAGANVQHLALLNRQMRFKVIAVIQIGSAMAGVLVGVGMAWLKQGYWSLVGMNITTGVVALAMTWLASGWRPQGFVRGSGTRPLLHFGANMTAGTFVYSLARGLDGLLIGRFCEQPAVSLGLYSRASAMLARPLEQFMTPIEAVFLPAFSRLQTQPEHYREMFLEVYEAIALFSFLFTGMCFALAHPLTLVVLGAKWEGAANIFGGFTFAALQYPVTTAATWLLSSQGRGRDSLIVSSVLSAIVALSFVVGLPYGPIGVAVAYSVSCLLLQMPVLYWLVGRHGPVKTADLWGGFLRHLPVWGVVTAVVWMVRQSIPDDHPLKELLLSAPLGLLVGAAFISAYPPSRRVVRNLFSTLREFKNSP